MGGGVGQGVAVMALGGVNRDPRLLVDYQDVGVLVNYGQGQIGRGNIPGRLLLGQGDGEDLARVQPVSGKYGFPSGQNAAGSLFQMYHQAVGVTQAAQKFLHGPPALVRGYGVAQNSFNHSLNGCPPDGLSVCVCWRRGPRWNLP